MSVIHTVQLNNIISFHLDANYQACLIVFHRLTVIAFRLDANYQACLIVFHRLTVIHSLLKL